MSQPTPYVPSTDFIPFTNIGYVPGQQLDIEFNNLATTLTETLANLALIQRDDGALTGPVVFPAYTVAALPDPTTMPGGVAMATDATGLVAKGSAPTGGGSTKCMLFSTGAAWQGI